MPFGGESLNPSWEAVRRLDGVQADEDVILYATKLPMVYEEARIRLITSMHAIRPDVIIGVGQAGGRSEITPERIAVNVSDSSMPDNNGRILNDETIIPDGPAAYGSTLPNQKIVQVLKEMGIPAKLSHSAGTFVCNQVFYGLMHELSLRGRAQIGGFIHVPYITEQTEGKSVPSLPLHVIVNGLRAAAVASSKAWQEKYRQPLEIR
ncbi:pyroglutamyl-peptidase I [Sporolactobacillus sp. THM7-4]|nr:pyroglutamyl-peptidase I [Sporolactobacillus sp. THM7-4]